MALVNLKKACYNPVLGVALQLAQGQKDIFMDNIPMSHESV